MNRIADLDGTILGRWSPGDYEPVPGPVSRADAILTNQGGLALRWAGLPWAAKYPDWEQTRTRVRAGMKRSGARIALLAIYHPKQRQTLRGRLLEIAGLIFPPVPAGGGIWLSFSRHFRKPSPSGLLWLIRRLDGAGDNLYIGDEDTDEAAALAVGIAFRRV